ncbi:hypothetical protein [Vulcanisaeta sp. JCM 16161]|uniref:hypothetical protein n=1 Tax=Vulcanisaeta sp. JCM 16161 TaxID=1295372 RepID=UPI001FB3109D|nr:hypothetical protein [Vulcanisaeta sp. JCM 16161]
MGFKRSDSNNYWFKDYGNNVILKVTSQGSNEVEIELDMPIPTGINPQSLDNPEEVIKSIMNSPVTKDLRQSLSHALSDLLKLRLTISMSN